MTCKKPLGTASSALVLGFVMGLWMMPSYGADGGSAVGSQRQVKRHIRQGVEAVAVSPDGSLVGAAGDEKKIQLLDARTGAARAVLAGHLGADVTGLTFSSDGQRLASVGRDGVVRVWDTASGQENQALQGHEAPIRAIAASPDGRFLASAGEET